MSSIEVLPVQNGTSDSFDSSDFSLIPEPTEVASAMAFSDPHADLSSAFQLATQDMSLEDIQKRLVELVEDNESMKGTLKSNNLMMKQQLDTITEWHNQITTTMSKQQVSLSEAKDKLLAVQAENSELKKRIKELEGDSKTILNDKISSTTDNASASCGESLFQFVNTKKDKEETSHLSYEKAADATFANLKEQLKSQESQISELNKCVEEKHKSIALLEGENQKLREQSQNLQKQLDSYSSAMSQLKNSSTVKVADLESKCQSLEFQMLKEQQEAEKERELHSETKKLLEGLQHNYDRTVKLLEKQSKEQKSEHQHELDVKMYLEQLDKLMAENFDKEQKLDKRTDDIKKLQIELQKVKEETESIPILTAQVEEYKSELDNATLAKESLQVEVGTLKRELRDFQTAVSFCGNCGAGNESGLPSYDSLSDRGTQAPPHPQTYDCPLCGFGFDNLQAAENHVNTCLDNAGI